MWITQTHNPGNLPILKILVQTIAPEYPDSPKQKHKKPLPFTTQYDNICNKQTKSQGTQPCNIR